MLEWTGGRYIPTAKPEEVGAEIHYEHLHRYYFAAQFVKGKVVLDLGCGEGYGSYILSKYAKKVVGVDIDDKSIKHASSTYIRSNLEYRVGSVTSIPVDGEEIFDAVICFEVLEHIAEHEEMLQEVKRVLKKDGIFVVSTPNKKVYSDEPNYQNPFHVKELYFDEFKALLGRYFKHIYFFGQRVYPSSQIWCLTEDNDRSSEFVIERGERSFVRVEAERKEPMYFIAIASDSPLKEIDYRSYLTDVSSVLINNFRKYIRHLEKRLRELEVEVGRLNSIVEQKERQIGDLSASLDKLNTEVAEKSGRVYELENALKIKDGELSRLQQEIESLRSAVRDREAEIERLNDELERISGELESERERVSALTKSLEEKTKELNEFKVKSINLEQKIRSLEGELKEKESLVERLNGELTAREKAIEELRKEEQRVKSELAAREEQIRNLTEENIRLAAELDSIKSSVTWRAVMKWHSFVERVAPLGTRRRRWYDLGIKGLRVLASSGFRGLWRSASEYRKQRKLEEMQIETKDIYGTPSTSFNTADVSELEFPNFENPEVSIVIPVYNNAELTYNCLKSILSNTAGCSYEVILVDDASTEKEVDTLFDKIKNVKIIRNKENVGFVESCNIGAKASSGKYILFLNNDTIVTPGWLPPLLELIKREDVGAVGAKLAYPDGKLQEAGGIIWKDASGWNYGRYDDPERRIQFC
ncbi:glycosyltransferase [Archaeoglobus fulgidus]|uniref:glycosyltransferase n=1 Tax=Archaeoglobus fulgidus TaxID=2234 RepID=UPI0006907139|nr:glycosyltransferase [Archaeoglobus fulgidus]